MTDERGRLGRGCVRSGNLASKNFGMRLLTGLTLAAAASTSGCALVSHQSDVAILQVHGEASSNELDLSIDSCNAELAVAVDEGDEDIVLTVSMKPQLGDGREDCLDSAKVALTRPLGERVVIDTATGEELPVTPPEVD